jgi:hypothetical protein
MAGLSFHTHETVDPLVSADEAAVTLATTYKGLIPAARYNIGSQFFNKPGRKLRIRAFGKITTAATPGNGQVGILFGTGADNNGVNVCQSAAFALIASQTNLSWNCEIYIHARSLGATGTLFGTGWIEFNPAVVASTAQPLMIPASAAAVSAAVDLTGSLIPSLQFLRSGSTAGNDDSPGLRHLANDGLAP